MSALPFLALAAEEAPRPDRNAALTAFPVRGESQAGPASWGWVGVGPVLDIGGEDDERCAVCMVRALIAACVARDANTVAQPVPESHFTLSRGERFSRRPSGFVVGLVRTFVCKM